MSFPSPASPDIFRLAFEGKYVYLPIDSTETITVRTTISDFGREFTLEGSANAELMEKFEKDIMNLPAGVSPDSLGDFKRKVYSEYMKDSQGSILSYYILTKTIDGKPLYNPGNSTDMKYFGAVATGFKTVRPDDPHTRLLEETTLNALKQRNNESGRYIQIEADEISIVDMEFPDEKGKTVKLSDIAGKGKPVVVIFSIMGHPDSPGINYELAQIYNRHNVEYYNVFLDDDQISWHNGAVNLPWITVYGPAGKSSEALLKYNVDVLPTFFVYDGAGNLLGRTQDTGQMEKMLR